uniref:SET domain-containing protein n=1 Tax=Clytia hemisphaerica TaxID=252671 RepID=A0A7M5V9F1_9CNID
MKRSTRSRNAGQKLTNTSPDLSVNSEAYRHCNEGTDPDFLVKHFINQFIGYGVFVNKNISPYEFLCEYPGDLISEEERDEREQIYTEKGLGSYIFDLEYNKQMHFIDGTPTNKIGRFINDSRIGFNAKMVVAAWGGRPHLCLFATSKEIVKGTEVRYCYGATKGASWRKQKQYSTPFNLAQLKLEKPKFDEKTNEEERREQPEEERQEKPEEERQEKPEEERREQPEEERREQPEEERREQPEEERQEQPEEERKEKPEEERREQPEEERKVHEEVPMDFNIVERTQNGVTEIFDEIDPNKSLNAFNIGENLADGNSEYLLFGQEIVDQSQAATTAPYSEILSQA